MAAKKSKSKRTKALSTRAAVTSRGIKPIVVTYKGKLKDDKRFLISMIDDPVRTFREYGFNGDDKMMAMLQGMAANLRNRAIANYSDIFKVVKSIKDW